MAPVRSWLLLAAAPFALVPAPAVPVDGVWRSQGYGYVFAIEGRMLRAFEVTATTCVPAFTAERDPADVPGREATFKTPEGQTYFIRDGGPDDHKRLHSEGSASDVRIDRLPRLPRLPAMCDHPTANTPVDNFRGVLAHLGRALHLFRPQED